MPIVKEASSLPVRQGDGVTETLGADPDVFGVPVPMRMRRVAVDPGVTASLVVAGQEVMTYVLTGSGSLASGGEHHALASESMAWVDPGSIELTAGDDGLVVLVIEAPGQSGQIG